MMRAHAHPPLSAWAAKVDRDRSETVLGEPLASIKRAFREEAGLPVDRPIAMTGHQAYFWHAGVLAKFFATDAWAAANEWAPAWIVPDQDAVDPFAVRVPVRSGSGRLSARVLSLVGDATPGETGGLPACATAAARPRSFDDEVFRGVFPSSVFDGLKRMIGALERHADASSGARQVASAASDIMSAWIQPAPTLFASDLSRTALFGRLVDEFVRDPEACVDAYNRAARAHPDARVAALVSDDVQYRYEAPLWRWSSSGPRRRVFLDDLESEASAESVLAPRALLMTGLLRLAGADLFVHGTGAARYDRITADWFKRWLGVDLAPMTVVTADAFIDFGDAPMSSAAADRAVWRAHHARHEPSMLGDDALQSWKRSQVELIGSLRGSGEDASSAFRELHARLAAYRRAHASALDALEAEASDAADRRHEASLASDRSWAFPLLSDETLTALRGAFDDAAVTSG